MSESGKLKYTVLFLLAALVCAVLATRLMGEGGGGPGSGREVLAEGRFDIVYDEQVLSYTASEDGPCLVVLEITSSEPVNFDGYIATPGRDYKADTRVYQGERMVGRSRYTNQSLPPGYSKDPFGCRLVLVEFEAEEGVRYDIFYTIDSDSDLIYELDDMQKTISVETGSSAGAVPAKGPDVLMIVLLVLSMAALVAAGLKLRAAYAVKHHTVRLDI